MVKTKVTLDITHVKERTMTGKITSPILVAQRLRATFCTNEWIMEHVDSRINEMVVMYQDYPQSAEQVIRPSAPTDVSVCKGIMSCFSCCCVFYCHLKTYCGPCSETMQSPE